MLFAVNWFLKRASCKTVETTSALASYTSTLYSCTKRRLKLSDSDTVNYLI